MVESSSIPPPSNKPCGITYIKAYILFTNNLECMNYDVWRGVFETDYVTFGVIDHLSSSDDKVVAAINKKEWDRLDALAKMWIFDTITHTLT